MNSVAEAYEVPRGQGDRGRLRWKIILGLLLLVLVLVPLVQSARSVARNRSRNSHRLKQLGIELDRQASEKKSD